MMHKYDFSTTSSATVEDILCQRIETIRLSRNMTQQELAEKAGISRSTITRLAQEGKGISLDSFIRILQALGLTGHLDGLVPDQSISPLAILKAAGEPRQRARSKKGKVNDGAAWTWGETDNKS